MKHTHLHIGIIMGLMITYGTEFIRYNPSNHHIGYSTNRGSSRYSRK